MSNDPLPSVEGDPLPASRRVEGNALDRLAAGTARDLRGLQAKLTYVGPQNKPLPTVVWTTFYHLVDMGRFVPLRTPGLSYANDDSTVWHFAVTPEEMVRLVAALAAHPAVREAHGAGAPLLSLTLVLDESRLGHVALEAVLDRPGAEAVTGHIRDALDADNGVGRQVVDLQRRMMFP